MAEHKYNGWVITTENGLPFLQTFSATKQLAQFNHRFNMKLTSDSALAPWDKYKKQGLRAVKATLILDTEDKK